jgi:hypothetical protein
MRLGGNCVVRGRSEELATTGDTEDREEGFFTTEDTEDTEDGGRSLRFAGPFGSLRAGS